MICGHDLKYLNRGPDWYFFNFSIFLFFYFSIFFFFSIFLLLGAKEFLQKRAVANFSAADANYGKMIQTKLVKIAQKNKKRVFGPAAPTAAPLNPPRNVPNGGNSNL